jgi:hypothetical protein
MLPSFLVKCWRGLSRFIYGCWTDPLKRLALIAGLLTVACWLLLIGPPDFSTASVPQRWSDPQLEVQTVRDVEDLRLTLGDAPSQDRETMRIKLRVDYAFIASYVLLLISLGTIGARSGGWRRITGVAAAITGLAAGVFDVLENLATVDILDVKIAATTEQMLAAIRQPAAIKWSLVALSVALVLLNRLAGKSRTQ